VTTPTAGQGTGYAWKAYAPGAYSSHFSPLRGTQNGAEDSPITAGRQDQGVQEAALALSDLEVYSQINKSVRSESPLLQQSVSPLRNSTVRDRSPIALSSPIYSFGRGLAHPLNASHSSRLTFPTKPRQSAFSKLPISRVSSPGAEENRSLGTSVQSRQGTPTKVSGEPIPLILKEALTDIKSDHVLIKKDVDELKERDKILQEVFSTIELHHISKVSPVKMTCRKFKLLETSSVSSKAGELVHLVIPIKN
jgi:hypothetical protein